MKKRLKCPKSERFFNDEKTIVDSSICLKNSARNNIAWQVSIDPHLVNKPENRYESDSEVSHSPFVRKKRRDETVLSSEL